MCFLYVERERDTELYEYTTMHGWMGCMGCMGYIDGWGVMLLVGCLGPWDERGGIPASWSWLRS